MNTLNPIEVIGVCLAVPLIMAPVFYDLYMQWLFNRHRKGNK